MRRNPGVFTYRLSDKPQHYYRHELLHIPGGRVDRHVPRGYVTHQQHVVDPQAEWEQDWPSDDTRF